MHFLDLQRSNTVYSVPVMRENHLSVMSLEEFEPNREFVGRNFNAGEIIQLVLKSPSSGRWLPFEYVQMVMMHELAHCKQMNHSRAFWAVRNHYATQMYGLWSKGYTGDGIWGRGANLATGQWETNTVRAGEVLPEHLCGGTYRSRRKRKGKQQLSYQERKQRRIEKKFGKNGMALGADDETKVKLEKGKKVQGKPRVAGSARGRELRAAAALARFDQQRSGSESVKEEDVETESGSDEEDAVDFDGKKILDGQGRGMIKVCEDEDTGDPSARNELDELLGVFRGDVKIKSEPVDDILEIDELPPTRRVKNEPTSDAGGIQSIPHAVTAAIKKESPAQTVKSGNTLVGSTVVKREDSSSEAPQATSSKIKCGMCSYENTPHSLTCAICANVLDPESANDSWKCTSDACKESQYINSSDCGVCGLCGRRKP